MKKLFVMVLAVVMLFSLAACGTTEPKSAKESKASASQSGDSAAWKVKVGDVELTGKDLSSVELVTQNLKKQSKEGDIKEHECVGYTLKSILDYAKVSDFSKVVAVSSDGSEYELKPDIAVLPTTMLTVKQDGEAYKLPRLAVDGGDSKAWLKDIVEFKAEK